jgi:hypothetical protein
MGYFSTIGIFYLIYSLVWKKFNKRNLLIIAHTVAIALSLLSFATRSPFLLLLLQFILLIVAVVLSFMMHKKGKKLSQLKVLYILVAILWLFSLFLIGRKPFFPFHGELLFQLISLAVFVALYHKISRLVR